MNIKKAIQRITKAANNLNKLKLKSITYVRLMALIAVLPFILSIYAWLAVWITGDSSDWAFKMQKQLLDIIDHFYAPAVIAGILTFAPKLVDRNQDGVPDDFDFEERKGDKTNEGIYQSGPRPERGPGPWSGKPEQWRQGK